MTAPDQSIIRLALPSKGELEKPTLEFLAAAGLGVSTPTNGSTQPAFPPFRKSRCCFSG